MRKSKKKPTSLRPNRGRPKRKRASVLREHVFRDPEYRAWIRKFYCLLCWPSLWSSGGIWDLRKYDCEPAANRGMPTSIQGSPTEAAHIGPHAMRKKAGDDTCIPLCGIEHHREGKESAHKLGKKFAEFHGLDIPAIQAALRAQYAAERGTK
jgi:hypothetical protein